MTGVRPALANAIKRRWIYVQGAINEQLGISARAEDVSTYQQMKADNDGASALYRAGEFWSLINKRYASLIWAGALDNVRNEFFNRRFAGPEPESRQVYKALLYLYRQKIAETDSDGFLDRQADPPVGGTGDQENIRGHAVSLDFLQGVEEMYRVREAWRLAGRTGSPRLIVELGAGYGRVAYVARKMLPDCTYVILDLPEALMCSSTWLKRALGSEVVPYAEARSRKSFSREELLTKKVWILGAHQIEQLADASVDAFINIYSFAEMPRRSTDNYFGQIDRVTRGVLFSKQRRIELNVDDDEQNDMEHYRAPSSWKQLFVRDASLYEDFFEAAWATRQ